MVLADDAKRDAFLARMGAEIRSLREASEMPQQAVADLFGWQRDAISKIENGRTNLSLYDYLRLMIFLRDTQPDHPAVTLADHLIPRRRR